MKIQFLPSTLGVSIVVLAMMSSATLMSAKAWSAETPSPTSAKSLLNKPLVGVAGKEGLMLTVEYAPGIASAAHRHNANTFVYVLEGSVVMQVKGGAEMTLKAGETFYESPSDIHSVSRNASATERAKILVFMVKDVGAPVTTPAN